MRVVAYFENGMIREFNTETFCTAEPFKDSARSTTVCCEFVLCLDKLDEGLRLNIFWYDGCINENTRYKHDTSGSGGSIKIPVAQRRIGTGYLILSKEEMEALSCLEVDGKEALVKEGDGFINMLRFNDCMNKYVSEAANNKSDNALQLYSVLHGRMSDDEIFEKIGMSEEIFTSLVGEKPGEVNLTPEGADTQTEEKPEENNPGTQNQEPETPQEQSQNQTQNQNEEEGETPDKAGNFGDVQNALNSVLK